MLNLDFGFWKTKYVATHLFRGILIKRATTPVLTSGKEEINFIGPTILNFAVSGVKLGIYIIHNSPELLWKIAPALG